MAKQKKEQKSISKPAASNKIIVPKGKRFYALIVFVFSCVLYCNTLFNDYNLDDELVTQNHRITSKGWNVLKFNADAFNSVELKDSSFAQKLKYFLPVVFRVPYYQDNDGFKYEYRPVVFVSFALEHALFAKKVIVNGVETEKDSPTVSHFINILLYALLCTLLFSVLCAFFKNYNLLFPFIISLLFVAYPMHTEVVASIKNRDEVLALTFGLLSLWFSFRYIEKNKASALIWVLLFFVLGILSKSTVLIFALLIPLCAVFFTNVGYKKLMLIAVVLVIPAVFYSRLYSAVQQITLAVVLLSAVTGLYMLKNKTFFWAEIKKAFAASYNYFTKTTNPLNYDATGFDFGFLKNPITATALLLAAAIPLGISVFGIYIYNSWVASIPFAAFIIFYAVAKSEMKVLFTTPVVLVALYALVKFFPQSKVIELGLVVFLGSQIFSGQKPFRVVGLVNYLVYAAVSAIFLHSFYFIFIVLFAGLLNRKFFFVSLIAIALSAVLFFKKLLGLFHGHGSVFDDMALLPVIYVFVFILWRRWWKQAISFAALLIPLLLITYFTVIHPRPNTNAYYATMKTYYRLNAIRPVDPTPVQSLRPLRYLEYPVSYKDPLSLKAGTSLAVMAKYLQLTVVLYPMSYYYGYSYIVPQNIYEVAPLFSLLIHLIMLATAIYFFRKKPVISFSILFYLISIAVCSNPITPVAGMVGDRFLLIPSIGFCILVVYLLSGFMKQNFEDSKLTIAALKLPLRFIFGALLLAYSGLTFSRNNDWKDALTLFRHDIKAVENSAQAHNLLAVHLFLKANDEKDPALQKQMREEAIPHFKKAIEIYPDFLNASYDLGRTLEALHRYDEALEQYRHTVKMDSTFVLPYFNMGAILHNKGQYAEAIPMYQKFLTQYPKELEAYTNLSFAYFKLNDFEHSIATNRRAIQRTGETFIPVVNIAKTYVIMNQPDSALFYWEWAHTLKPNDAVINSNIEQLKARKQ